MIVALACCLALAQDPDLPRSLAVDDPAPSAQEAPQDPFPPAEPARPPRRDGALLDLDWIEVTTGVGLAVYSPKYRADPAPGISLRAHAPMPWLSPSDDPTGEYFGLSLGAAFMTIERRLSPSVAHRRGLASLLSLGLDYSFVRDSTWILMGRAGVLYAHFGDIADLKSGVGPILGATAGVQISGRLALTYTPDVVFGRSGSVILLNTLGLLIQF